MSNRHAQFVPLIMAAQNKRQLFVGFRTITLRATRCSQVWNAHHAERLANVPQTADQRLQNI